MGDPSRGSRTPSMAIGVDRIDRRLAGPRMSAVIGTLRASRCSFLSPRSTEMSRGFPSMTALLGLLAVAGFQNRDKLAEMLGGQGSGHPGGQGAGQGQVPGQQQGGLG